ncbi:MAG: type VI secretion system baseplate subunit TssF [Gemmatimonadaceae bacterium]|nr:type VI secretion system baseplate subunit TssF [Gemmatimonadaceae bacterium]
MRDDLKERYEDELRFLRATGREFAQRYPKIASRLQLEADKCEDPHVERLLEGVAFLAARVQLKLDDDFPEITEAFFNAVMPHYVRPIPALSVVEMELDPDQAKLTTGFTVPRDAQLFSRPVDGAPVRFRTAFDVTLWPLAVTEAAVTTPAAVGLRAPGAVAALRLVIRSTGEVPLHALTGLSSLRLHLAGDGALVGALLEALGAGVRAIYARPVAPATATPAGAPRRRTEQAPPIELPLDVLQPVGFGEHEGLLPYPRRSFLGYRALQEYFALPQKYHFIDLGGFDLLRGAGFSDGVEFVFLLGALEPGDRRALLEEGVGVRTFRLGCTPVANLFPLVADPILLDQRREEYLVVADARRRLTTSVYAVEEVGLSTPGAAAPLPVAPLYSPQRTDVGAGSLYWYTRRRPATWRTDGGTDLHLALVDRSGRTVHPDEDSLTLRCIAYNGDLASKLRFGDAAGDFTLKDGGPIGRITSLIKPTPVVQPPLGKAQLWRLISQLSLTYLSLVDDGPGPLQELLRLYQFDERDRAAQQQIAGIVGVRSAPAVARVVGEHGIAFARGRRVELDLDDTQFAGGSPYLFAAVLEHFLGLYASINSFSQLSVRLAGRAGWLKEWAPRAGRKPLL